MHSDVVFFKNTINVRKYPTFVFGSADTFGNARYTLCMFNHSIF